MNTIITDWQVVTIIEDEKLIGKILWGTCVEDMSCRFITGDYICTSKIMEINTNTNLIKTAHGNIYQVLGRGRLATIDYRDFELLRGGFSPQQIKALNHYSPVYSN
jgi:hypothetical protein